MFRTPEQAQRFVYASLEILSFVQASLHDIEQTGALNAEQRAALAKSTFGIEQLEAVFAFCGADRHTVNVPC